MWFDFCDEQVPQKSYTCYHLPASVHLPGLSASTFAKADTGYA
jgi:hypothetical protein